MKRLLLLILVLAMIVSVTACSSQEESKESEQTTDSVTTDDQYAEYLNSLPEKDYEGKDYGVLCTTQTREFYIIEDENVLLSDTILMRDSDVKERYNVNLNYIVMDGNISGSGAFTTKIRAAAASGDEAFDVVLGQNYYCMPLATESLWQDLNTAQQLQWDREWYHQNINQSAEISGKKYGASGEYLMSQTSSSMCLLYNKNLYESNGITEDIYQLVRDHKWTYEAMNTMVSGMYQDVNDNQIRDGVDMYGFLGNTHTINSIIVGGDCPIASYDANGAVTVNNYYSDHLISVFDYLYTFFNDNESVRCATATDSDVTNVDTFSVSMLASGKTLFASTWMGNLAGSQELKNSKDSIGVVPNPLYDEGQEEYVTYNMRWELFYIPVNADMEYSATILEYLNFTSMKYMLPQYYENALRLRGADNVDDSEMLEIIHDSMYYDFVTVFSSELGGLRDAVAYLIKSQSNTLSSWWSKNKDTYSTTLILMTDFYS